MNFSSLKNKHLTILIFIFSSVLFFINPLLSQDRTTANLSSNDYFSEKIENWITTGKHGQAIRFIDSIATNNPQQYEQNLEYYLRFRGNCKFNDKNYTEAFKLYFDALKLSQKKGNNIETAKSGLKLGLVFLHFDEPQLAIKLFKESEVVFKKLDINGLSIRSRYLRAISLKRIGEYQQANAVLDDVKTYQETQEDLMSLAKTYNAIGLNYKNLRQVDLSVKCFKKAIELFDKLDKQSQLAKAYNNLANVYNVGEEWGLAIVNHQNSIEIKERLNDSLGIAISYINLSVIYKENNNFKNAFEYGNKSIKILEQIGNRGNRKRMEIYSLMAELHEKKEEHKTALIYAQKEKQLLLELRIGDEAMLIELFTKKQDVKFYTISDSLVRNQEILKGKIIETETKNEALAQEKSRVFNIALVVVFILLSGLIIVMYSKYISAKKMKEALEIINNELFSTRISKEEKEVLLQEIHHRVKNNMQIISSLIRLQSNQTENENAINLFTETQNRINSMALVHELLYRTKDFQKLELKAYITELVNHLFSSYQLNNSVTNKLDISNDKASVDNIIPIGLIINEIVSNSLKHGFKEKREGVVHILFRSEKESGYLLETSDNGDGNSENNKEKPTSLGMELVDSLVMQLDGEMTLDKTNGYHYMIRIPKI